MKKHLLLALSSFAFLLLAFSTQAQNTTATASNLEAARSDANPTYEQFNERCILDKVEYKADRTIFHFRYKASKYSSIWLYSPEGQYPWFLKDEANGDEYKLLGVYNIRKNNRVQYKEITENYVYMSPNPNKEKTYFECEVHFERLPAHVAEVDLIEGQGQEEAYNHFNCFDIKVNPLKEEKEDVVVIKPIQTEDIILAPAIDLFQEAIAPLESITTVQSANETEETEAETTAPSNNSSKLVSVTQESNWSVFPTPATTVLNVKQSDAQRAQLTLLSVSGQIVWSGTIQGTTQTINVSELAAGAYILQHTSNNNTTAQKVLIK